MSVHLSSRCESSVSISLTQRLPGSGSKTLSIIRPAQPVQVAVLFPARGLLLRLGLCSRACFGCCCLPLLFLGCHLVLLDRVFGAWLDAIRQPVLPRPHEFVASETSMVRGGESTPEQAAPAGPTAGTAAFKVVWCAHKACGSYTENVDGADRLERVPLWLRGRRWRQARGGSDDTHKMRGVSSTNAYAEHFVRTVRAGCLDWLLILGRCHLERTLGS